MNWKEKGGSYIVKSGEAKRIVDFYGAGGSLLDYGAGNRKFLRQMKDEGISLAAADVEKFFDAPIPFYYVNGAKGIAEIPRTFDTITAWNVLEHIYDPKSVVEELGKKLNRNGLLIVSVPNVSSWLDRLLFLYYGEFHRYNKDNDHVFIFTNDTRDKVFAGWKLLNKNQVFIERLLGNTVCYVYQKNA